MKKTIDFPTKCPSCGSDLELDTKQVNLWCKNPACGNQLVSRILHYVKTLEIDGVGEGIISGLCEQGLLTDLPDLYYLTPGKVALVTGGNRSGENVVTAILEKNQVPLAVFLDSLGVDGLGTTTSKDVAKKYKSLEVINHLVSTDMLFHVATDWIEGIGSLTASKIIEGLRQMKPTIDKLTQCIDVIDVEDITGKLSGKSFLITGTLSKGRKEIEKEIVAAGGEIKSSVSKNLGFLVVGEDPGSKVDKADKVGVRKITERELREMMD